MTNLIEVVFEKVAKSCVIQLLALLIQSAQKITDTQCSESISLFVDGDLSEQGVGKFLDFDDDASLIVILQSMKIGDTDLPKVQLRLVKYGNQYDIDFNFDTNELENINTTALVKELHGYVKDLAAKYDVASFFAGMEPASDEDTRYFTNDELGPLAA